LIELTYYFFFKFNGRGPKNRNSQHYTTYFTRFTESTSYDAVTKVTQDESNIY